MLTVAHKRQKSTTKNNQSNWTSTGVSGLTQIQTKKNPYLSSNASTIQQLMAGQTGGNSSTKYSS